MWRYGQYILLVVAIVAILWLYGDKAAQAISDIAINDIVDELPRHPSKRYAKRLPNAASQVIIHHSGTTDGSARAYARTHVEENDWPGMGYHYVIDKDGTINQTQNLDTVSYHAPGANQTGIGVCLTGNFDTQTPTQAQLESAQKLVKYLNGLLFKKLSVVGHRDVTPGRTCPGRNLNVAALAQTVYA